LKREKAFLCAHLSFAPSFLGAFARERAIHNVAVRNAAATRAATTGASTGSTPSATAHAPHVPATLTSIASTPVTI
jgi:hypothetical protein